jgi:sulfite exporter TauE/SafE
MHADLTPPLAFLAGLAGAGHCWTMCGGLVGGLFLACGGGQRLYPHLAYHGGRVLAYTLLGALAAGIGQAVVSSGGVGRAQGVLYIAAGMLVLLAGARVAGWLPLPAMLAGKSPPWPLAWPIFGFLNGLMPCALVFSLTLKAATAPSVASGAAWLFAFGLGTVPAMLLAGVLAHWLGGQSLIWLRRVAGLLVMALGLQAVLAGVKFFHVMLHL